MRAGVKGKTKVKDSCESTKVFVSYIWFFFLEIKLEFYRDLVRSCMNKREGES